jgi:hypothetical protein
MAEEVGSELVALISDHLSKVKQALQSRSNMDRTMKEEAIQSVSEMDTMLNRLSGMFQGLESMLEKTLKTAEKAKTRLYSEQLAASHGPTDNQSKRVQTVAHPNDTNPPTFGLVVKAADEKTSSHETKRIIKETVDPKALKLGVSKIKNLANEAVFVECGTETDRDILEKELNKISAISVGRPKKKLPTLLLKFVPIEIEDADIKSTILQQNNLLHLSDSVLQKKFTKRSFEDARHVVIEVSPCLRRELLTIHKLKLQWSMCEVEDFITVTRCHKCLGFGHTARFCQNQAKCSFCAGDHHRNECANKHEIRCSNCTKANTHIRDKSRKANTNHSVFSRECPRLRRIESIIISKTEY